VYFTSCPVRPSWFNHHNGQITNNEAVSYVLSFILLVLSISKSRYSPLSLHPTCSSSSIVKAHVSYCSSLLIFHVWVRDKFRNAGICNYQQHCECMVHFSSYSLNFMWCEIYIYNSVEVFESSLLNCMLLFCYYQKKNDTQRVDFV